MRQTNSNQKILSLLALIHSGDNAQDYASALSVIDWPEMTSLIIKKGLAGHFYSMLHQNQTAAALIPANTMQQLKNAARRVAARNAFYETHCADALMGLNGAGVDAILLKGFAYMQDIYGDTSTRGMSDIDLLIRPDDREKAFEYLLKNGYEIYIIPAFKGSREDFDALSEITGETHFMKKSGALTASIDLHWKMRAEFPMNNYLDLDKLPWWENTQKFMIGGAPATRLSPEMQFIHLAMHFAIHHHYYGLRWFVELFLFLKKFASQLNWGFIYDTAASADCRKLIGVCLRLINDFFAGSLPAAVSWRGFLPARALLPGEYRFYKKCLKRETESRLAEYICMPLSPATVFGRLKMVYYFFFDAEGIIFWHGSKTKVPKLLLPLYNIYVVGRQLLRKRDA